MSEDAKFIKELLPTLAEPMPYKWRVQSFSKFKAEATCVAYIDARDVQDRLDEHCAYGWSRDHKELKGHLFAGVGVWLPSGGIQWRWDCGTESATEKEKGESSDSFKRSAINWGPGRFLYNLKIKRLPANDVKKDSPKNFPHVVDSKGKKVWDITEHINGLNDVVIPKQPLRNWVEEIKSAGKLESLKEIFGEAYQSTEGPDKAKVKLEYDKRKVEIEELGGSSNAQR